MWRAPCSPCPLRSTTRSLGLPCWPDTENTATQSRQHATPKRKNPPTSTNTTQPNTRTNTTHPQQRDPHHTTTPRYTYNHTDSGPIWSRMGEENLPTGRFVYPMVRKWYRRVDKLTEGSDIVLLGRIPDIVRRVLGLPATFLGHRCRSGVVLRTRTRALACAYARA